MNSSLTALSPDDDLQVIVTTLTCLLEDASKRGDLDISPVARGLIYSLMGHRPTYQAESAELIYIVSITAEVINPGDPGLPNKMTQAWRDARSRSDYDSYLELTYLQLRTKAHRLRADASNARMSPSRRRLHELCMRHAERQLSLLVPA